ncbi:MAG: hypothetical protein MUC96_10645 [Myxococcaceae bacterium]|nr:hypothetical protein [Myxococcaceae bacterium]
MREALLACLRLGFGSNALEGGALDVFEQGGCVLELRLAGPIAPEAIDQWLAGAPTGARIAVEWPFVLFRFEGPPLDSEAANQLFTELQVLAHDEYRLSLETSISPSEFGSNPPHARLIQALQDVRLWPTRYIGSVEDPRVLVRVLLRAWADDFVAGRGMGLELELRGDSLLLRSPHVIAEDLRDLDVFALAEPLTHAPEGLLGSAAATANAVSSLFSMKVATAETREHQRWRAGRRAGAVEKFGALVGARGVEFEFTPDPTIFGKPLTLAMVQHEATRVAMSVPTSLRVNGTLISFPNLEPLAREIIGVTPLWSDRLLVFDVNLDEVRVQLAIGFSDEREAPLRFLENADEVRPDQHVARDSFCRALRAAVDLKSARKPAPLHHVTGVISAHRRTSRWAPNPLVPAPRTEVVKRLSQALAVFLDEVPLARERLRASWTGPRG